MKYSLLAIILLYPLSAISSEFKMTITPDNKEASTLEIEAETQEELIKKFKKIVIKSDWIKGKYTKKSNKKSIFSITEDEEVRYWQPNNVKVEISSMKAEKEKKKKEKADKKAQEDKLFKKINESNLEDWHKRLLRRLIKND